MLILSPHCAELSPDPVEAFEMLVVQESQGLALVEEAE
jgi:hypothetical protein